MSENKTATAKPLAARDVLMKYEQQWEHLASEGHVLLARVAAYRHKVGFAYAMVGAAAALGAAAYYVPTFLGGLAGAPARLVANWIESAPAAPVQSPAPSLKQIAPRLPGQVTMEAFASIPSRDVIASALAAAAKTVKAGGNVTGCLTTAKITDEWATLENFAPKCRTSQDKSRTWVWGAMTFGGDRYGPFMALIRKDADGEITVTNVMGAGARIEPYGATDPAQVPRAIAADFPELTVSNQGGKQ